MKTFSAAIFKKRCLALLKRLGPEGVVIAQHGQAVAKLIPVGDKTAELVGSLTGKVRIKPDILSTGTRDRAIRKSRRVPIAR